MILDAAGGGGERGESGEIGGDRCAAGEIDGDRGRSGS